MDTESIMMRHKERESRPIRRVEKEGIYLMEFVESWVNKGRLPQEIRATLQRLKVGT